MVGNYFSKGRGTIETTLKFITRLKLRWSKRKMSHFRTNKAIFILFSSHFCMYTSYVSSVVLLFYSSISSSSLHLLLFFLCFLLFSVYISPVFSVPLFLIEPPLTFTPSYHNIHTRIWNACVFLWVIYEGIKCSPHWIQAIFLSKTKFL